MWSRLRLRYPEAWSGAPVEHLSPATGDGLFGGTIAKLCT